MAPRSTTPLSQVPSLAPDEPWIAYLWGSGCGSEPIDPPSICLVRPDGSGGHPLPAPSSPNLGMRNPDWSPDGRMIAYTYGVNADVIWVANADGTDAREVMRCDPGACEWVDSAAWSPDGTELVYVRFDPAEVAGTEAGLVYIEALDLTTGETRVVSKPSAVGADYVEYVTPRWSPDGTQVVFVQTTQADASAPIRSSSIAIAAADGSGAGNPRIVTDSGILGSYPDWSPDGTTIVFSTGNLGGEDEQSTKAANLFVIRTDGTGLTQLTRFGAKDTRATQPTWTPDGQRIIFTHVAYDPTGKFGGWGLRHIAFIDLDGSNLEVMDGQYATHPRLRPTP